MNFDLNLWHVCCCFLPKQCNLSKLEVLNKIECKLEGEFREPTPLGM